MVLEGVLGWAYGV